MANGKAMTVGEMASLFLDPATPVRIDAFDGSHFGPADADLKVKIATPNCMYQLLAHPNEIGIVRSYILGDFDVDGIDYADPYPAMRKLVSLSKYVRPLTPTSIARVSAGILSHGFKRPPVPATEGPSKFARIKRGLMPHTERPIRKPSASTTTCPTSSTPTSLILHDLHLRGIRQRTHEP